jgi:hypothetical protein
VPQRLDFLLARDVHVDRPSRLRGGLLLPFPLWLAKACPTGGVGRLYLTLERGSGTGIDP